MHHIAHEVQNKVQILSINVVLVFHSLAHEPQNLQTAEDHLMLSHA
jgi:hypothetical protein